MRKLMFIIVLTLNITTTLQQKEEICVNDEDYKNIQYPENGQAVYFERGKRSGKWMSVDEDGYYESVYIPKDEVALYAFTTWIWHDCGQSSTYGFKYVCLESGDPDWRNHYLTYDEDGEDVLVDYSSNPDGERDRRWTHWYVASFGDSGRAVLCHRQATRGDPGTNCRGPTVYIYKPPACVGWEKIGCCLGAGCKQTFTQGLKDTSGSKTTLNAGLELSATFGASYLEIVKFEATATARFGITQENSKLFERTDTRSLEIPLKEDQCVWVIFQTYGRNSVYTLTSSDYKVCDAKEGFC